MPTYSPAAYLYTRFRTILGIRYVDAWEAATLVIIFVTLAWLAVHLSVELWRAGAGAAGRLAGLVSAGAAGRAAGPAGG